MYRRELLFCILTLPLVASCGSNPAMPPSTVASTVVSFDSTSALATPETFFDFPFPSDLRIGSDGAPDLRGFPNPQPSNAVEQLRQSAMKRTGYPVIPVAWFKFS